MNPQNTSHSFYNDKRLREISPERIEYLRKLADELSGAPQNQKMNQFLRIMQQTSKDQISFSSQEQELLFSVLTETMSPEERRKAETIRKLAAQLRGNRQ